MPYHISLHLLVNGRSVITLTQYSRCHLPYCVIWE